MDRSRGRAPHRRRAAAVPARVGRARRRRSGEGTGPLRRVARRAPRRDRGAADLRDGQVRHGRRPGGAAPDHDRVVLHQDDGEGAGARDPARVAAVPVDQEDRGALPSASDRRHRRAVELPRRQPADGRDRRPRGRVRRAAEALRAHPADRRTAAARLDRLRGSGRDGHRAGRPRGRRGRRRRQRLHPVHRIQCDRSQGDGARRASAHPRQPGARRQGPDDRARGRRRRPRRPRRGLGGDVQRGPDLRLGRARVRARAGLRPVRRGRRARRRRT